MWLWVQYYLERACHMVFIARSHGLPLRKAMSQVHTSFLRRLLSHCTSLVAVKHWQQMSRQ